MEEVSEVKMISRRTFPLSSRNPSGPNRRTVVRSMAGAAAGMAFGGGLVPAGARLLHAQATAAQRRRRVSIAGRRTTVVDIHAHVFVPEVCHLASCIRSPHRAPP